VRYIVVNDGYTLYQDDVKPIVVRDGHPVAAENGYTYITEKDNMKREYYERN